MCDSEMVGENDEEIVRALIAALESIVGTDFDITPSTNLVDLERETHESLLIFETISEFEEKTGLYLRDFEWINFYRDDSIKKDDSEAVVAPRSTVQDLAEFIQLRTSRISYAPVRLCATRPCAAAGYFLGMTKLLHQTVRNTPEIGPSTPIRQILKSRSDLRLFWERLERTTGHILPQLSFWVIEIADVLIFMSMVYLPIVARLSWALLAIPVICLFISREIYRRGNPLPTGILTFGDLARHLAGRKVNWT